MKGIVSINCFSIKNIVNFRGHKQELLKQGDVYYKGKKIGFYSQNFSGGTDYIDIDYEYINIIKKYMETKYENENEKMPFYLNQDYFFLELLILNEDYNYFKKAIKQGYLGVIFFKKKGENYSEYVSSFKNELALKHIKSNTNYERFRVYKSLEDFIQD